MDDTSNMSHIPGQTEAELEELWTNHDALLHQRDAIKRRASQVDDQRWDIKEKILKLDSAAVVQYARRYCQQLTQRVSSRLPRELRDMIYQELLLVEMKGDTYTHIRSSSAPEGWNMSIIIDGFPGQFARPDYFYFQFRREFAEFYYQQIQFICADASNGPELLEEDPFRCGCTPSRLIRKLEFNIDFDIQISLTGAQKLLDLLLETGDETGRTLRIYCMHNPPKDIFIAKLISDFGPQLRELRHKGFKTTIWSKYANPTDFNNALSDMPV
ncbi:hypothetical protein K491DRAFT_719739 [Lophiostoma macrostomum CBS 122681]|uniref:Uncharacterized protein n=1 Tax=Lophiostoma macrostomum CBS 122681 TaxID=1314788 RepID=A0A6A6SYG7_9PLEO|nr:hypothetical protein K491DRAFT_719739 [Lophiostoma macrostomum CBS 122681]